MTELTVREQLHNFADDLENALSENIEAQNASSVILCGMGGSAISSMMVNDLIYQYCKVPLMVVNYPKIPGWANKGTLAIVSSYSGNTRETLMMYEAAKAKGCKIVVISSGGKLTELAKKDGYLDVALPKNMQPRHSVGFQIGYTLALLRNLGAEKVYEQMKTSIPELLKFRDYLENDGRDMVEGYARRFICAVPCVRAVPGSTSIAFRWISQISENSKHIAVIDRSMTSDAIDLSDNVPGYSEDRILCNLRQMMVADYASMKAAENRGLDPAVVGAITRQKELLNSGRCTIRTVLSSQVYIHNGD
ncbi:MAG: hypothetical protein IJ856_02950 [Candidatus Methanomethylophilaceae archaeon]|nr:hypothetical protein [Candidatus Methanomethylophilaceae archaeon]